jgi:hypothetical protein
LHADLRCSGAKSCHASRANSLSTDNIERTTSKMLPSTLGSPALR